MRNEQDAGGLARREVEDEVVFRTHFALHIYCFICINGCIATPVIEACVCNLWDLSSSPSGTLFIFHIFIFSDFGCFWQALGPFGPGLFLFFLTDLLAD